MTRDDLIRKVKKLLVRTDGANCTEAEVESSMRIATRLMDEHNLAMSDVLLSEDNSVQKSTYNSILEKEGICVSTLANHDMTAASLVCEACDVKWFRRKTLLNGMPRTAVVFYGLPDDVAIALEMFLELRMTLKILARVKLGRGWTKDHFWYCEGFTSRLLERIREQKKAQQVANQTSTALIVVKGDMLVKYGTEKLGLVYSKRGRQHKSLGSEAFNEGHRDAGNFNINRSQRVASQSDSRRLT